MRTFYLRKSDRPDLRWGRAGERGKPHPLPLPPPLSLTLPRKGGREQTARVVMLCIALQNSDMTSQSRRINCASFD